MNDAAAFFAGVLTLGVAHAPFFALPSLRHIFIR